MQKYTFKSNFTTLFEFIKQEKRAVTPFTILYVHGLCSDPFGKKPEAVKKWAIKNNVDMIRFELAGHGSDADNFINTDMNIWKNQILEIIDEVIKTPVLMVGSSIGGWLSLLAGKERKDRVVGIIGLAAAPDFMRPMFENVFTEDDRKKLQAEGFIDYHQKDFEYHFTQRLIESGFENEILNTEKLDISCPVILIHGIEDKTIPFQHSFKIANKLSSDRVTIKLRKYSDHHLNKDDDISELLSSLDFFYNQ